MSLETNISNVNQNLSICGQPAAAVAQLGQFALSGPSSTDLFTETVSVIAQMLTADLVLLWELNPDGDSISLQSSYGWTKKGAEFSTPAPLPRDSFESFVLASAGPVLIDDIKTETRFKPAQAFLETEAVSGVGIRIGTIEHPIGLIEVFWKRTQSLSRENLHGLEGIASILALHMDAKRKEIEWQARELELQKQLAKIQSVSRPGHREWDRYEIRKRLMESQERERLQLAQRLHDIPIQDLYGLMYQLDELQEYVQDPAGREVVQEFNKTIHTVVSDLRTTCADLRPPSLSPFGLEVAIRDHVEKLHKLFPDLQFHLELLQDQQSLSNNLRLFLFRVYQQAISNVVRHARATDVYVRFRWDDQMIHLEVEDDGIGFVAPQDWLELVQQERFGLVGLAERVENMQGKLDVISTPGEGTLVRVIVPVR